MGVALTLEGLDGLAVEADDVLDVALAVSPKEASIGSQHQKAPGPDYPYSRRRKVVRRRADNC